MRELLVAMGRCLAAGARVQRPGRARDELQEQHKKQGPGGVAHGTDDTARKKAPRGLRLRGFRARGPGLDYMPMPPMPPMSGMAGAALSALGASETMHSVVSIRLATEAAFCSAVRVTLVGSRIPISIMSP